MVIKSISAETAIINLHPNGLGIILTKPCKNIRQPVYGNACKGAYFHNPRLYAVYLIDITVKLTLIV